MGCGLLRSRGFAMFARDLCRAEVSDSPDHSDLDIRVWGTHLCAAEHGDLLVLLDAQAMGLHSEFVQANLPGDLRRQRIEKGPNARPGAGDEQQHQEWRSGHIRLIGGRQGEVKAYTAAR